MRALLLLAVAMGCSKPKPPPPMPAPDEVTSSSQPAGDPPRHFDPPPPPKPLTPAIKVNLKCDKVVTAAIKDKYFKGLVEKEDQGGGPTSVNCDYYTKDPAQEPYSVSVLCPNWLDSQFRTAMDTGRSGMPDAKAVHVGRMGYVAGDDAHADVWDDDTMCLITIAAPHAGNLAKDLAVAISPATIQ